MSTSNEDSLVGCFIFVAVFVLFFIPTCFYTYATGDTVVIKVNRVENIAKGGDSKYLVFTENEVFENTDTLLRFKFDSSDIYNEIEVGKKYKARVYGWRVRFLSWYRNIVDLELIE